MIKGKPVSTPNLQTRIHPLLEETPSQSVKELADKLGVNRNLLSGYLQALEELGYVSSRQVGPARVYYNNVKGASNDEGGKA